MVHRSGRLVLVSRLPIVLASEHPTLGLTHRSRGISGGEDLALPGSRGRQEDMGGMERVDHFTLSLAAAQVS